MAQPAGATKKTTTPYWGSGGFTPTSINYNPYWGSGGVTTAAPKKTTKTPAQAYIPQTFAPSGGEAGGYEPATMAMPDYGYSVNIDVPNFNWNPNTNQLAQYLQSGTTRANTVIDPQVSAILQALSRFKTEAGNQQNEINPRYTDMSLALANVIKNQVYQPGVDQLIRRGAADSGALQQLGESAGRYETEQRAGVETERNQILNALANQVMAKGQETTDAQTALEKLRGQYTDVYAGEEQQKGYEQFMNQNQSKFNADLQVGQLQNSVAAAIANQQYQQAVLAAQQQQSGFENQLSEKQYGLEAAMQAYNMRPKSAASPNLSEYDLLKNQEQRLKNAVLQWQVSNPTGGNNQSSLEAAILKLLNGG